VTLEHQRRDLEALREAIAAARFAFDRNAAQRELVDVTIDRAFGELEPVGEGARGDVPAASEVLDVMWN
jgi:hypothetical protein